MIYYRTDTTKLSFRELWNFKPGLPFLVLALMKLSGTGIKTRVYPARPDTLQTIDPATLAQGHRDALDPLLQQLKELGFEPAFFYAGDSLGNFSSAGAALAGADRFTFALLAHTQPLEPTRPYPPAFVFYSQGTDGTMYATAGGARALSGRLPEFKSVKLPNSTLAEVWDRHVKRIQHLEGRLLPLREGELADVVLRIRQRVCDNNVARGIWVPLGEDEVRKLKAGIPLEGEALH